MPIGTFSGAYWDFFGDLLGLFRGLIGTFSGTLLEAFTAIGTFSGTYWDFIY